MVKFGQMLKISILGLSLAAIATAPVAQAGPRNKNYNNHSNNKHYSNNRHNYKKHSYKRNNYGYNYGYGGYSGSYYGGRRRHNSHGNGGAIALGVLTGGLLFYALSASERRKDYNRTVYVQQQQPVYAQPTQQQWTKPAQSQNNSCLQTREYQTTITVGGQSVPAYGQSCLQPDGSWKLGPAIPEPGY